MELADGFCSLAEAESTGFAGTGFGVMTFIENNHSLERTTPAPVKNLVITTGVDGLAAAGFATDEGAVGKKENSLSEGCGTRNYGMAKIDTFLER